MATLNSVHATAATVPPPRRSVGLHTEVILLRDSNRPLVGPRWHAAMTPHSRIVYGWKLDEQFQAAQLEVFTVNQRARIYIVGTFLSN